MYNYPQYGEKLVEASVLKPLQILISGAALLCLKRITYIFWKKMMPEERIMRFLHPGKRLLA